MRGQRPGWLPSRSQGLLRAYVNPTRACHLLGPRGWTETKRCGTVVAMKKITRAIALTAVAAIALTGCVRVEMNIDLQENDTVDGEMIFAFSQEMLALAGEDSLDELLN